MPKREKIIERLRDMSNICANRGEIQSMRTLDDAIAFLKDELAEDCEDCQEYDTEKHYCPRYCKVIRETLDEMIANAPKWILASEQMPENYGEYLVTVEGVDPPGRYVTIWTYLAWCGKWADGDDDFVVNPDEDGVVTHWMKIPEPAKEDSDGE